MDPSFFLARALGLYLCLNMIFLLRRRHTIQRLMIQMIDNEALQFLSAILALLLGSFMVAAHNVWRLDWTVLITLLAWLTLLKGIFLMLYPQQALWWRCIFENKQAYGLLIVLYSALGVFLLYQGFFHAVR